jgi:hypothetical protein
MHIINLYRLEGQDILMFKECFALEKIHGTSAHIAFNPADGSIRYFTGSSHANFVKLFNEEQLLTAFKALGLPKEKSITVYGENYGGKEQGMSATYGKESKFVVFDVKIGDSWLNVPEAEAIVNGLGLEFVHYRKVSTELSSLDAERDAPSVQAIRNGVSHAVNLFGTPENPKIREGVVLRPIKEMTTNNGHRVMCKHKRDEFRETATVRTVETDPAKLKVLEDAKAIANEWVTATRLEHVLQKITDHGMDKIPVIMAAMIEDITREGSGEIVDSKEARKAISGKTVELYKVYLKNQIGVDKSSSAS